MLVLLLTVSCPPLSVLVHVRPVTRAQAGSVAIAHYCPAHSHLIGNGCGAVEHGIFQPGIHALSGVAMQPSFLPPANAALHWRRCLFNECRRMEHPGRLCQTNTGWLEPGGRLVVKATADCVSTLRHHRILTQMSHKAPRLPCMNANPVTSNHVALALEPLFCALPASRARIFCCYTVRRAPFRRPV